MKTSTIIIGKQTQGGFTFWQWVTRVGLEHAWNAANASYPKRDGYVAMAQDDQRVPESWKRAEVGVHTFDSTELAYDVTQFNEAIKSGDILHIPSERVIGVCDTWPFAVTKEHGELHVPDFEHPAFRTLLEEKPAIAVGIEAARALAEVLGYELVPTYSAAQREAMAEADAHLNNANLPSYTQVRDKLAEALDLVAWAKKDGMRDYPGFQERAGEMAKWAECLQPKAAPKGWDKV